MASTNMAKNMTVSGSDSRSLEQKYTTGTGKDCYSNDDIMDVMSFFSKDFDGLGNDNAEKKPFTTFADKDKKRYIKEKEEQIKKKEKYIKYTEEYNKRVEEYIKQKEEYIKEKEEYIKEKELADSESICEEKNENKVEFVEQATDEAT